jgi:hypothetical protein
MPDLGSIVFQQAFDPQKLPSIGRSKNVVEDNEERLEGRTIWDNKSETLGVLIPIKKGFYALNFLRRIETTHVTSEETVVVLAGHIVVSDSGKDRTIKSRLRDLEMKIFILFGSYPVGEVAAEDDEPYVILLHLGQKARKYFIALSQVA